MKDEKLITCPKCGNAIDVNEVLYHDLEDRIKKDYDKKSEIKEKEFQTKFLDLKKEKESVLSEREDIDKEKENLKQEISR